MGTCWDCKYLIGLEGTNFIQDFKCNWFEVHKGQTPKNFYPDKNPDEGCKQFKPRKSLD